MKRIILVFVMLHVFYNNAHEEKNRISPLTTVVHTADVVFNVLVIHNTLSRISNPRIRVAVSAVTALGMSASTFVHTFNRQDLNLDPREKMAAATNENTQLIGIKTQNCLYPVATTLPFALVAAIFSPRITTLSYTLRAAQWLEKSVPLIFSASYVLQSAVIASMPDPKKVNFTFPDVNSFIR